ncbi:hypothetical protein EDF60_0033 [Leucobacter luti]|uniref:hypothetical protein n=1 Tax=Leucobacter luti TaxID=340320 RepID=UPI00104AD718|nr:hypothetical protein [Leucobacter luti]MCW2289030.1 hypothetical protein [Leucobacter luti]TCK44826.1 hypothetical protein EDF60_0033 [Leucobacter luti]
MRLSGACLVLLALGMMWSARITFAGDTYVSGLGAHGEITASAFNTSLGMVAAGGALSAVGLWGLTSWRGRLGGLPLGATLLITSAMFAVAASVPCSTGCPLPLSQGAEIQDLIHTSAAVLGFALAGIAILQTLGIGRRYTLIAAPSIVLVILTSATGGLLSLAGSTTALGGWLELIAASAALFWLASVAVLTQFQAMDQRA